MTFFDLENVNVIQRELTGNQKMPAVKKMGPRAVLTLKLMCYSLIVECSFLLLLLS